MASENSSASISGREKATLITKIETVSTPATFTSSREKPRRPTWNAVSACALARARRRSARTPSPCRSRRRRRGPAPWWTTVPMNAHDGRSSGESLAAAAAGDFSTGSDSPVSTASSHSSCVALEQPEVGRHDVPDAEGDDVAGHELATSHRDLPRRRARRALCGGCRACSAATAFAARYSLTKPRPTLSATIARDDRRVGRIAGQARDAGGREQQQEQRVAQLAHQDGESRHAADGQRIRAERAQACLGFNCTQAGVTAFQALEHDLARQHCGARDVEPRVCIGNHRHVLSRRRVPTLASAPRTSRGVAAARHAYLWHRRDGPRVRIGRLQGRQRDARSSPARGSVGRARGTRCRARRRRADPCRASPRRGGLRQVSSRYPRWSPRRRRGRHAAVASTPAERATWAAASAMCSGPWSSSTSRIAGPAPPRPARRGGRTDSTCSAAPVSLARSIATSSAWLAGSLPSVAIRMFFMRLSPLVARELLARRYQPSITQRDRRAIGELTQRAFGFSERCGVGRRVRPLGRSGRCPPRAQRPRSPWWSAHPGGRSARDGARAGRRCGTPSRA